MSADLEHEFYSADVELWIDCGEFGVIPLWQTAEDFVIAARPSNVPPCDATVYMSIDGRVSRRAVRLVEGMNRQSPEAAILSVGVG